MTESMDMDTKMQKFDEEIEQILDLLEEKAYFRGYDCHRSVHGRGKY